MVHSFARDYLDNLGSSAALGKPFFRTAGKSLPVAAGKSLRVAE
jgi:hypothetical protein